MQGLGLTEDVRVYQADEKAGFLLAPRDNFAAMTDVALTVDVSCSVKETLAIETAPGAMASATFTAH